MKFNKATENKSNLFVTIKPNESVVGVLAGDPYEYSQHWGKPPIICPESDCKQCSDGLKPQFRFRLNFIINENGAYTPKILEMGWTVYKQLKDLNDDYDLTKHLIKIRRDGTGKDTKYNVIVPPKSELSEDQLKNIAALELVNLKHRKKSDATLRKENQDGPFMTKRDSVPDFDAPNSNDFMTKQDDNLPF